MLFIPEVKKCNLILGNKIKRNGKQNDIFFTIIYPRTYTSLRFSTFYKWFSYFHIIIKYTQGFISTACILHKCFFFFFFKYFFSFHNFIFVKFIFLSFLLHFDFNVTIHFHIQIATALYLSSIFFTAFHFFFRFKCKTHIAPLYCPSFAGLSTSSDSVVCE